jgi:3-hydroxyisobutyrate dehydrogenase-like beta-hydroxyacid dehydrogenase
MAKDLAYSLKEGERHDLSLEMVSAALKVFCRAEADGHGEKDFAAVVKSTPPH